MSGIIVKSNQVIRASYRINPNEQAIILNALTHIEPNEDVSDKVMYTLRVEEMAELTNTRLKDAYSIFKEAALNLYRRELMFINGSKKLTRWVQTIEYIDGKGILKIQFSNQILPYLTNLKDNFTTYNLKDVAKFKSTYGVRFYELCKQWQNTKQQLEIPIIELKDMFQLDGSYERIDNIKKRVIEPALKDINEHSDLYIGYENIKTGRKITGFIFKWKKKRKQAKKHITDKELHTTIVNHDEKAKLYQQQKVDQQVKKRSKQACDILKSLK